MRFTREGANFISHRTEPKRREIFHNSRSELFHIWSKPNISLEKRMGLCHNESKKGGERSMNFSHCDHNENYLTLHDCIAERAYFENGKLGFEFHDGFWVSPNHPESNLSELVRTDRSILSITMTVLFLSALRLTC